MSEFKGKYVCYQQADGGACWGRIKDEAVVNKIDGEKEVFVLTDRYVRYVRSVDKKYFRQFYPQGLTGPRESKDLQGGELFHEVRKVKGDTTIHKDMIDLDKDVVDVSEFLDMIDKDTLFKAILGAREGGALSGKTAVEIGIRSLAADDNKMSAVVKEELQRRLEKFDTESNE